MNKNETLRLLKFIKGAYGRFEITEESPEVWYRYLKDQQVEKVMHRLDKHIANSKFEPTISDLLPKREEKEKEIFDREVARNQWLANGGNPNEFFD